MRGKWLAAAAALALAGLSGCGNRNFEKPDGTFDREGYRSWMVPACIAGIMMGESGLSREERNQICLCMINRLLSTNNDAQMREMSRDRDLARRKQGEAVRQCSGGALGLTEDAPNPGAQDGRHYFDPQTRRIVDANGVPIPETPPPPVAPPPPLPPVAPPAASNAVPTAPQGQAIVRNRSGRALSCGLPTGEMSQLPNGEDFDIDAIRVRCDSPVVPVLFDLRSGRTYDLVPGSGGTIVYRDVTPAR